MGTHYLSKSEWEAKNRFLIEDDYGIERDTGQVKKGDGVNRWNELPYLDTTTGVFPPEELPSNSSVSSVAGRAGDVTLTALDISGTFRDNQIPSSIARDSEVTSAVTAASTSDRMRANHTGVQPSTTISDFTEAVQDAVAALLGAGSNVIINYDDAANTLSISSTGSGGAGLDPEQVRDAIGVALVGVGNVSVTVNDAADTITFSTTATVNSTDAALRARSSHTGTQLASTIGDSTTIGRAVLTAADASAVRSAISAGTYSKPTTGIPETDLAAAVQTKLNSISTGSGSYYSRIAIWDGSAYKVGDTAVTANNRLTNTYYNFFGGPDPATLGITLINGDQWKDAA